MNQAKHDAIVAANAALSGADLPTYDDLVRAVNAAHLRSCARSESRAKWTGVDQDVHEALSAILVKLK